MRRVVVTGLGILSSIGTDKASVLASLREARSGVAFAPEYKELGFRSHVHAPVELNLEAAIPPEAYRFMGDAAAYSYLAMAQAIEDSALTPAEISHGRTGLIVGSGGPSTSNQVKAVDILRARGNTRRIGPRMVPRCMSSTCSAVLSTMFKIRGVSYSVSSACSTSAHCIGNGAELIQMGKQDIVFAGGGEEVHWTLSCLFDAIPAMSSRYNDRPAVASRCYDAGRDGFVISGGGGIVVLEAYEHARARGARIYAELVGYGATSDGADMVQPSGEGSVRCMKLALDSVRGPIDYLNTHGTSTPVGDIRELEAIRETFPESQCPWIGSTKSLTGHALGAAGANEAIYTLLMMQEGFMAESAHIETLDPAAAAFPILRERRDAPFQRAMSNSFGFGGTNASLVFEKI